VPNSVLWIVLGLGLAAAAALAGRRLVTWVLTLRARALTPTLLRVLSRWVRTHSYSDVEFFRADGAGDSVAERRRAGIERLAAHFHGRYPESTAWGERLRESFSDLRFTDANRVPFPFARYMHEHFNLAAVVTASDGPRLQHLDGHWTLDVSGSYGVNVAGVARYKEWMGRGLERTQDLGLASARCTRSSPTTSPASRRSRSSTRCRST
jgi:glutamate-1-semialdehyde 2,1-aminomutase